MFQLQRSPKPTHLEPRDDRPRQQDDGEQISREENHARHRHKCRHTRALTRRVREQVPGLHESVLRRTPAARWGVPDDFAGIAVFLAAPASDFVTGAAITVDGGYSVQG
jgi:NAD(P)-dependent dehydrogenase (short-subunit alcohol dehydrogenase family)